MKRLDLILAAGLVLLLLVWLDWQTRIPASSDAGIGLGDVLGGDASDFPQVEGPIDLEFPDDHASHDEYRNEWWYFTGNLVGEDGRRFGFQYTLFRFHLGADPIPESAWSTDQLWMAHIAISDAENLQFFSEERFARGALGLAGATTEQWWLGPWRVEAGDSGWRLSAQADAMGLELDLVPDRALILQGDRGFSRKGPEPGQASRYYSHTRLNVVGRLDAGDWSGRVEGLAWLDREWGSGQLDDGLAGWDWFALHLDDGRDLMVYRLRQRDGRASPFSAGALVWPDGRYEILDRSDFQTEADRLWRDEQGVSWPLSWRIAVPAHGVDVEVDAVFNDQRWRGSVSYWEGMVDVTDAETGDILGRGYMELSGYADQERSARRP